MPSIYQLKPRFQNLLRPLVQRLHARGVTANQVTLAAAAVSVLLGLLVAAFAGYLWLFALIPLWMFLRMALNAIDGMLAREFGQQSVLGAYLNELCDVIADSALILPFAMLAEVSPLWVVVATLLAVIVEYAGVMGPLVGAARRYDGPLGKSDRAFVFGVLGAGVATGLLPIDWLDTLFMLIAALLVWTLANRVRQGIAEADRNTPPA
ncbi:CDP-diacylglycerol--glycerol-3-phosphate 3-phosphatidyltransferase [Pseudomonas linyingensis]|uniref:CDP-diacylglycerol--glycerol-3-phosphate 3-phosphatidyltransferase n=1 Tax=Pseudomonas linyingensis TaxID=915471 RepID=A0A1H7AA61_9PSED|nr:CDP-alcohol phosphatidyltransferase family protein [Pseudomonas linyingensis]SEJ61806.1 CDP-diacylglycerol--glycerol-3-phosphate 3-phosphatidyltransferase [Pseudomonas linyingensis]